MVAVAYDKTGKIMATGYNSYTKTHPLQARYAAKCGLPDKCFLHAEVAALIKAKGQVDKLVVARIGKTGKPLPAKPCPICEMIIKMHGVRSVEFTT